MQYAMRLSIMALLLLFAAFSVFGCEGGKGFMDDDSNCVRESNAEMNKGQTAVQESAQPCSDPSPLQAPAFLSAEPSDGPSISLNWQSGDTRSEGFSVERADMHSDSIWTTLALTAGNITGFIDRDIVPGRVYRYRIKAFCSGRESMPSVEWSAKAAESDRQTSVCSSGI